MEIHFSHPRHKLKLVDSIGEREGNSEEVPICNCCCKEMSFPGYACEYIRKPRSLSSSHECSFYLHNSCAELAEKISHPLHPHPLILRPEIPGSRSTDNFNGIICDGCRYIYSGGFTYYCKWECEFNLHPKCASQLQDHEELFNKNVAKLYPPYHNHALNFCKLWESDEKDCCCCKQRIDGSAYCCLQCQFFIHESCKEIPNQVQHPFHPQHKLVHQAMGMDESRTCNACMQSIQGISMGCSECNFNLHVSCTNRQTPYSLKHKCHQHNMYYFVTNRQTPYRLKHKCLENSTYYFVEDDKGDDKELSKARCNICGGESGDKELWKARCNICGDESDGIFYRCVECDVNLHLECIPIRSSIKHNDHVHPIILTNSVMEDDLLKSHLTYPINEEYYCDVCETPGNPYHHAYCCKECLYVAHVECIISEVGQTSKEKGRKDTIHQFFHEHQLKLRFFMEYLEASNTNPLCCWCCKKINGPGYCCIDCKFFIHDFCCTEISPQLQHPLHPHPLHPKQNFARDGTKKCRACRKLIIENLFLCCQDCNFNLHILCAKEIKPFLERKCHNQNHNLEPMWGGWYCSKCCLWHSIPNFYRCMECDANTCFGCIPIPKRVKHKCHSHLFSLTYLTEAASSEYHSKVCEICKTQWTDPELVFCCEKCTLFVHAACMVSEDNTPLENPSNLNLKHGTEQKMSDEAGFDPAESDHSTEQAAQSMSMKNGATADEESHEELFSHPGHRHKLTLLQLEPTNGGSSEEKITLYCNGCNEVMCFPGYACERNSSKCKFYLHKSCAELPPKILHPLHPHPLTCSLTDESESDDDKALDFRRRCLNRNPMFVICNGCRDLYYSGFKFRCSWCGFNLDAKCASKQDLEYHQTFKELTLYRFYHKHALKLFNAPKRPIRCCCCRQMISTGSSAYCCIECDIFIHESCTEIPMEIHHPFHPQHILLAQAVDKALICNACNLRIKGINIGCRECDFDLHVSCANPNICALKHKCHEHNMYYFVEDDDTTVYFKCNNCHERCFHESFYRCVECDFNLHLKCIPIPSVVMITQKHHHSLTLIDSVKDDNPLIQ